MKSSYVFKLAGASTFALLLVATTLDGTDGLPGRINKNMELVFSEDTERNRKLKRCERVLPQNIEKLEACKLGENSNKAYIALWGDSHAEAIAPALDAQAKKHNAGVLYFSRSRCAPVDYSNVTASPQKLATCKSYHNQVLNYFLQSDIEHIILAGRWIWQYEPGFYYNEDYIMTGLAPVLRMLQEKGKTIWFFHQVPIANKDVPRAMLRNLVLPSDVRITSDIEESTEQQRHYRNQIAQLKQKYKFNELKPEELLCDEYCKAATENRSLYRDKDHLSVYGAMQLAELFEPVFN